MASKANLDVMNECPIFPHRRLPIYMRGAVAGVDGRRPDLKSAAAVQACFTLVSLPSLLHKPPPSMLRFSP